MTIRQYCTERNIDRLFHFTRVENLQGILANGLLPPSQIRNRQLQCTRNDMNRHDGLDAICLSIEWPNYKMFYPLRIENPGVKWAVLEIQHSVLWEKQCCFSTKNAADGTVSSLSVEERSGLAAFEALFGEIGAKPRASLGIRNYFPTNPQAEVSCFETIEPAYIRTIWLDDSDVAADMKQRHTNVHNIDRFHKPRSDYAHWTNG